MKYLLSIFFIISAFPVSAHTLEKDSTVGAVIHIDPDDNPIIGQPATIYIDIKDTAGKLDLQKCTCQVVISKDDKELFTHDITPSFSYTFPEKGTYELSINGEPKDGAAFSDFDIDHDIDVTRTVSQSSSSVQTHLLHILFFGAAFIIAIVLILRDIRRDKEMGIK